MTRRTYPLPSNWQSLRKQVLARDGHQCTWLYRHTGRCGELATDVDHMAGPDNHDLSALRSLCSYHHNKVTAQQANAARWGERQNRPTEQHPGMR
jgi:5-methylcytosine-specific restriction protein A